MSSESLLKEASISSPNIFYVHEAADQAYRADELPFVSSSNDSLESSCRSLSQHVGIAPLSSYLFSCCVFPYFHCNTRRWLAPGQPPASGVKAEFRLSCRHFTARQLAHLSPAALHYHFVSVKFDLLRRTRIRLENVVNGGLHKLVASLLNFDLCRILAKEGARVEDAANYEDLVTSLVRSYQKLLTRAVSRFNWIESLSKQFLWRKAPMLLRKDYLPDLLERIRGKHWTEFAIAYLDAVEIACPELNTNRYDLSNGALSIELGPAGLQLKSKMAGTRKVCDVEELLSAKLTRRTIQLVTVNDDERIFQFESKSDACSLAIELSSYYRILRCFGRPLLVPTDPGLLCPSQLRQSLNRCWGPLSESSDLCASFDASVLLRRHMNKDTIAFESAELYDVIGIYVIERNGAQECLSWVKQCRVPGSVDVLQDVHTGVQYATLEAAATAQLKVLTLSSEADQYRSVQPRILFEHAAPLHPFELVKKDKAANTAAMNVKRTGELLQGSYNIVEIATMSNKRVALKYVHPRWRSDHAVMDCFNRSARFSIQLKQHLDEIGEGKHLLFRRLLGAVEQESILYPRCMILEYLETSLLLDLLSNGHLYSLFHLLQVCLDIAEAVSYLHKINLAHTELSCKKLFVRQKPSANGFGELRVKLVEPNYHNHPAVTALADSQAKDLFDIGITFQDVFSISTGRQQSLTPTSVIYPQFHHPHRYKPHLTLDLARTIVDHIQRLILLLTGREAARPGPDGVIAELGTLMNEIVLTRFFQPDTFDHNAVMADRRIYCCSEGDLHLAAPPAKEAILGEGTFGMVWKVEHKETGEVLALKELKMQYDPFGYVVNSKQLNDDLKREMNAQLNLNHANVVKLRGVQFDKRGLVTGILTDYQPVGSLLAYLKKDTHSGERKLKWAQEIAFGMSYLHEMGIVHRDLAARNVLLARDLTAKVSDFGLSVFGPTMPRDRVPGPWWPPEWHTIDDWQHSGGLQCDSNLALFDKSGDVYSYGVTVWEIDNNGEHPKNLEKNKNGCVLLQQCVQVCTADDPQQRPTLSEVVTLIG